MGMNRSFSRTVQNNEYRRKDGIRISPFVSHYSNHLFREEPTMAIKTRMNLVTFDIKIRKNLVIFDSYLIVEKQNYKECLSYLMITSS